MIKKPGFRVDAGGGGNLTGFPPPDDLTYNLPADGIYLISYQGDDNMSITEALPDDIEPNILNIIGEGNAATLINGIWVGSLTHWQSGSGYWIKISAPAYFSWETSGNQRVSSQNNFTIDKSFPDGFQYTQSTAQAFYFVAEINSGTTGDLNNSWIISYHKNQITGARKWDGNIIDIPVMGNDGNLYSRGYSESGAIPKFKYLDDTTGELTDLYHADIPKWENNGIYILSTLETRNVVPQEIMLNAYPNPFNPVNTLSFSVPEEGVIQLSIYNISGQMITTLAHDLKTPGIYEYSWDANAYPSGVYFARLNVNNAFYTQKLVLMK